MDCKEFVESFVDSWSEHLDADPNRTTFHITRDLVVSTVKLAQAALEGERKKEEALEVQKGFIADAIRSGGRFVLVATSPSDAKEWLDKNISKEENNGSDIGS